MRILVLITILFTACNRPECDENNTDFISLTDLSKNKFEGFTGGKYAYGSNSIPAAHGQYGINQAKKIVPLNQFGQIDSINGKIGMLVLGYSTAAMTGRFVRDINHLNNEGNNLEIIIGAQGGRDINYMTDSSSNYYLSVDSSIIKAGLTAEQVQIIWLSSGDVESFNEPFPQQCLTQITKYHFTLKNLQVFFPNCRIVFISDRTYSGYVGLNGEGPKQLAEPTAYYNGWTIKWLIEKQISGEAGFSYASIPFIDWGPYLWTNGTSGNKLGYTWDCNDAGKGGIHPSSKGRMKEAAIVYLYFSNHPYLKELFIK
jgi:hypothetical protein